MITNNNENRRHRKDYFKKKHPNYYFEFKNPKPCCRMYIHKKDNSSFCFGFMIQKVNLIRVIVVIIKIKVNLIHNFNSYFNLYFKCSADIQSVSLCR